MADWKLEFWAVGALVYWYMVGIWKSVWYLLLIVCSFLDNGVEPHSYGGGVMALPLSASL